MMIKDKSTKILNFITPRHCIISFLLLWGLVRQFKKQYIVKMTKEGSTEILKFNEGLKYLTI